MKSIKTKVNNYIESLKLIKNGKDYLRFKKLNNNDFIPNETLLSIEHQMETFFRNSEIQNNIIYFWQMDYRTEFYLILKIWNIKKLNLLQKKF